MLLLLPQNIACETDQIQVCTGAIFGYNSGGFEQGLLMRSFLSCPVPRGFSLGLLEGALDGGSKPELRVLSELLFSGAVEVEDLGTACETLLHGDGRRARGAHLTTFELAAFVASRLAVKDGAVLDPACGCGHLLVAAARRFGVGAPDRWYGWDVDPEHVSATRIALWLEGGRRGRVSDFRNIGPADAILSSPGIRATTIIANPPFMSIRRLSRECGSEYVAKLKRAVPSLQGSFDLFAAFLLRLPEWLAHDGQFAVIVPAPFWSADYARRARMVLSEALTEIHDLRSRALFPDAAVSPNVLVGEVESDRRVRVYQTSSLSRFDPEQPSMTVSASSLLDGFPVQLPLAADNLTLGDVATIHAGTPGYQAKLIGDALLER